MRALDRDGWACVLCGRKGRLEVDHKRPIEDGGDLYVLANLQTLYRNCHILKSKGEQQRARTPDDVRAWREFVAERLSEGVESD